MENPKESTTPIKTNFGEFWKNKIPIEYSWFSNLKSHTNTTHTNRTELRSQFNAYCCNPRKKFGIPHLLLTNTFLPLSIRIFN